MSETDDFYRELQMLDEDLRRIRLKGQEIEKNHKIIKKQHIGLKKQHEEITSTVKSLKEDVFMFEKLVRFLASKYPMVLDDFKSEGGVIKWIKK